MRSSTCITRSFLLTRLLRGVTFLLTRLLRGVTPPQFFEIYNYFDFYSHASCEA